MTAAELEARIAASPTGAQALAELSKLGFSFDFLARAVVTGADVTVAHIAMLWQGMPNKHDRKRTRQMCELLERAGVLSRVDDDGETWRAT